MAFLPEKVISFLEAILPERYSRWIGNPYAKPSEAVDAVQERLRPFFEAHQFQRQNRCFCRKTADGVTLVVAFQISPWGLSRDGYGRFTINVGVFVQEVWQARSGKKTRHISDEKCFLRRRLGTMPPKGHDTWWPARDHPSILKDIEHRMLAHAFPYLSGLETRELCLHAQPRAHEPGWRIAKAILLHGLDRDAEALQFLVDEIAYAESRRMTGYVPEVRKVAERLGLAAGLTTASTV